MTVLLFFGHSWAAEAQEIVFENARLRAVLGQDAVWRSVEDKKTGRQHVPASSRTSFAEAIGTDASGRRVHAGAKSARLEGGRLAVELTGGLTLFYEVLTSEDWIAWRLQEIRGPRPEKITLVRLGVATGKRVGPRLAAAWDDEAAVCLRPINLQTDCRATRGRQGAMLSAASQDAPGPKLEGAGAALLAAPRGELAGLLARLAEAYDLPRNQAGGVDSKHAPLARQSYWFLSFGEKDVDKVIDYCRRTGLRQVMLSSSAWCRDAGHYTFRTQRYPDGLESLRRTVARLHAEGILVGMHCFASKVSKTDAYVTPVPDRRFWTDRTATLATGVDAAETAIRTSDDLSQWPGSPVASQKSWEGGVAKHQEVVLDDEIVQYQAIGPEGKWDTFLGCRRGAWATRPAPHAARTACRHYGVDGCINGYIIDQETTLLDEVTTRLAGIFNACDFDMVYFDGGEDVDNRRFQYYVSRFQAEAMKKFRKRPLVHMGTIMTCGLWHSFTRSGTVDTYPNTLYGRQIASGQPADVKYTVKDHIDRSVRYMQSVADDMMPGELGWFGIWPAGRFSPLGLQLDEIEYLMVRSLAYDAPISLQTSFDQMDRHPLTPGILEIVAAYERLRAAGVQGAVRQTLPSEGQDFVLLQGAAAPGTEPELAAVAPVPPSEGAKDLRAMVGSRGGETIATVWHGRGQSGRLRLDIPRAQVKVFDLGGRVLTAEIMESTTAVPIGAQRTTLRFANRKPEEVIKLLNGARLEAAGVSPVGVPPSGGLSSTSAL